MTSITLVGRGRGRFVATLTADVDSVTIRIDSNDDASFWCELEIPLEHLARLLESVPPSEEVSESPIYYPCAGNGEECCAVFTSPGLVCDDCTAIETP